MWKNIVGESLASHPPRRQGPTVPTHALEIAETNIMIATHADSLIAEAVVKGFGHTFNTTLAREAVLKDCFVAPVGDATVE